MQEVSFRDLGKMDYQTAWDYQERLLDENVQIKTAWRRQAEKVSVPEAPADPQLPEGTDALSAPTRHYLLFVEHPPVYTLGKSGHIENVLIDEGQLKEKGMQFFRTNRGGDITFHGPGQIVGYPVLDLEKFYTDIGRYLRELEEVIILLLAEYGIRGERSPGETGVWIDASVKGRERKICAIGVRCSRWITMHGFAFNVNTDLSHFGNIVPCGIPNKKVTSLEKELGHPVPMEDVKEKMKSQFGKVFGVELIKNPSE
jgi:lipoyl(octanoyl) transferase